MDIAKMSTMLSQVQVQQQASLAVMGKAMGAAEQQSNALVQMIEGSTAMQAQHDAQPHLGGNIDISI